MISAQDQSEFDHAVAQALGALEAGSADAKTMISRVAALAPGHPEIGFLEGTLALRGGDFEGAVTRLASAVAKNPAHPLYGFNLGLAYFYQGKQAEALEQFLKAYPRMPADAFVANTIGDCLAQLNRMDEAIQMYRGALILKPDDGQSWLKIARAWQARGHSNDAAAALVRAFDLLPKNTDNLNRIFRLAAILNRWSLVVLCCRDLIRLDPRILDNYLALSDACFRAGDYPGAAITFAEFVRRGEKTADRYCELSGLAFRARNLELMREALDQAFALDENHVDARISSAKYHVLTQNNAAAEADCRAALRSVPGFGKAIYQLADMEMISSSDSEVRAGMARLEGTGISDEERVMLNYGLGQIADREKNHNLAFEYFRRANELQRHSERRKGVSYNAQVVESDFAAHKTRYSKQVLSAAANALPSGRAPIFILGMPRSGTTLMDKIISNHGMVRSTGENPTMARIHHEVEFHFQRQPDLELATLLRQHGSYLANLYWRSMPETGSSATRFTDKAPLNFIHVGLIRCLFPDARIIHMCRDARDVCLSMYMHNFNDTFPCANDLGDLGHYYRQYVGMMQHWRGVMPGGVLDVEYQALVDSTEETAKAVIAFCGLEWDPRCLEFHSNPQAAYTFSELQVRKPIYRSSLHKWKAYGPWLAPLLESLNPV